MISRTIMAMLLVQAMATGTANAEHDNSDINFEKNIVKLDQINFLPSMLPLIIDNRDVIELTDEQIAKLLAWRSENKMDVLATMNEIIRKRIEIKEAALSPDISSARLIQMQNEIFRLQREVLEYKLSCRELVINTFTRNNWEGFYLVLADRDTGLTLPEIYITRR